VRSTTGKKIVTARPSFRQPVVYHERAPAMQTAAVPRDQNFARRDVWSGRQFVMLVVGIGY
jgi:hypothetical protein